MMIIRESGITYTHYSPQNLFNQQLFREKFKLINIWLERKSRVKYFILKAPTTIRSVIGRKFNLLSFI